jgi:RecA/RadA recombinase
MDLPVFWQDDLEHLSVEQLAELAFHLQSFILTQNDIIETQSEIIDELKAHIELLKGIM